MGAEQDVEIEEAICTTRLYGSLHFLIENYPECDAPHRCVALFIPDLPQVRHPCLLIGVASSPIRGIFFKFDERRASFPGDNKFSGATHLEGASHP
jgi:hypothetical protein